MRMTVRGGSTLLVLTALVAAVAVAGLSKLLVGAALAYSQTRSVSEVPAPPVSATQRVADMLDQIIQKRFEMDAGVFGVSRVVRPTDALLGHSAAARFDANTAPEARLLAQVQATNLDYVIAFLHSTHPPGKFPNALGPVPGEALKAPSLSVLAGKAIPDPVNIGDSRARDEIAAKRTEARQMEKLAIAKLPQLMKGQSAGAETGDRVLYFRPVRASKASCIKCHPGAKQGDTLGVMVYSVAKDASPAQP